MRHLNVAIFQLDERLGADFLLRNQSWWPVPVSGGEVFSVQSRSGVSPVPRGEKTGKKKRGYQSALPNNTKEK